MNEQRIQELKDALREIMQMIVQRGQPLNDDMKIALSQVMEHVASRIQSLRQEEQQDINEPPPIEEIEEEQAEVANSISQQPPGAPPTGGNVPQLDQAPHESSNINAFKYDPKNGRLFVKFQDKYPGQNGPIYSYEGVPKNIFEVFARGAVAPKTSGRNRWHTWKKGVTPSHGAAMNALIKEGNYPYRRLR